MINKIKNMNKKEKSLLISLIVLIVGILFFSIYITVNNGNDDSLVDNNDKENEIINDSDNSDSNTDNNEITKSEYKLEDFTKIINSELGFLKSKKNLKDLTDEEKTFWIYWYLVNRSNDSMTTETLENAKNDSSLKEIKVNYTDIYDTYDMYELSSDFARTLDKNTNKYSKYLTGHGGVSKGSHSFLVNYEKINNKYIISYKYIFYFSSGDGPSDINLFYKFEDINNKDKIAKEFLLKDYNYEYQTLNYYLDIYVSDNYDSFKDKLDTYTYVFEIHNENIILTDFYRESTKEIENKKISYVMEETPVIGTVITDKYNAVRIADKDGNIKLSYPVIKYDSKEINDLNSLIKSKIDMNINDLNNHKDVDPNGLSSCFSINMIQSNKKITYDHFVYYTYEMIESKNYLNIIEINNADTSCASGYTLINNVYVIDKNTKKVIYQNKLKSNIDKSIIDKLLDYIKTIANEESEYKYFENQITNNKYYVYYLNDNLVFSFIGMSGSGNLKYEYNGTTFTRIN